jgi:hypothetical protein
MGKPKIDLNIEVPDHGDGPMSIEYTNTINQYNNVNKYHSALNTYIHIHIQPNRLLTECIFRYNTWYGDLTISNEIIVNDNNSSTIEKTYIQRNGTQRENFLFTKPIKFNTIKFSNNNQDGIFVKQYTLPTGEDEYINMHIVYILHEVFMQEYTRQVIELHEKIKAYAVVPKVYKIRKETAADTISIFIEMEYIEGIPNIQIVNDYFKKTKEILNNKVIIDAEDITNSQDSVNTDKESSQGSQQESSQDSSPHLEEILYKYNNIWNIGKTTNLTTDDSIIINNITIPIPIPRTECVFYSDMDDSKIQDWNTNITALFENLLTNYIEHSDTGYRNVYFISNTNNGSNPLKLCIIDFGTARLTIVDSNNKRIEPHTSPQPSGYPKKRVNGTIDIEDFLIWLFGIVPDGVNEAYGGKLNKYKSRSINPKQTRKTHQKRVRKTKRLRRQTKRKTRRNRK